MLAANGGDTWAPATLLPGMVLGLGTWGHWDCVITSTMGIPAILLPGMVVGPWTFVPHDLATLLPVTLLHWTVVVYRAVGIPGSWECQGLWD